MSETFEVETKPGTETEGPEAPPISRGYPPSVPALTSALLLFFAFPPAGRGYLAWFALVPMLTLVRKEGPRLPIYLGAWAGGLLFWHLSLIWIWELHPSAWVAWIALATYQSAFWVAFLALSRLMVRRLRLSLMFVAPVVWVALEYVQTHALSGFPWYELAHSQYRYLPVIQISDLGGALGVSVLVAVANAWLAELLTRPVLRPSARGPRLHPALLARTAVLLLMLGGALGYGQYRIATSRFRPGPTVALLQSNIRQEMKTKADPAEILAVYGSLTAKARAKARTRKRAIDLVVWPETSFPLGHVAIDPKLGPGELDALGKRLFRDASASVWVQRRTEVETTLRDWARSVPASMIVGAILYDFSPGVAARANAAILVPDEPKDAISVYRKIHLVPFGEYVPLISWFPAISRLTPYDPDSLPNLEAGPGPVWFDTHGYRFAPTICFEDTLPHETRRFFSDAPGGREPDVLLDLSNDGWFGGSAEHDLHLAIGVFRAVENRVPLARAVNGGYSAVIDGNGRIEESVPKMTEGVIVRRVPLDSRSSLYVRAGDWVGQGCLALTLGLSILGLAGYGRNREKTQRTQGPDSAPLAQGPRVL